MSKLADGVITGVSNADYHADRTYLSSSVIKLIYKDIAAYKAQYIDGIAAPNNFNQTALDDGTLAHMLILEPELVATEVAVYPGLFKRGKEYDSFVEETKAKAASQSRNCPLIVSQPQWLRAQDLLAAYRKHPVAPKLVEPALKEHTICADVLGVPCKMRADAIDVEAGIISDVKTTSWASGRDIFCQTIDQLSYQLSAALYCMIAEVFYKKPFTFYFIVLSKKDQGCSVYKTSAITRASGAAMITTALNKLKKARETGIWEESSDLAQTMQEEVEEV